jgi:hypothetical protein
MAAPMPREPPVTSATFPVSFLFMGSPVPVVVRVYSRWEQPITRLHDDKCGRNDNFVSHRE